MGGRGSSGAGGGSGAARGLSASGVDVALVNTVRGTSAEKNRQKRRCILQSETGMKILFRGKK